MLKLMFAEDFSSTNSPFFFFLLFSSLTGCFVSCWCCSGYHLRLSDNTGKLCWHLVECQSCNFFHWSFNYITHQHFPLCFMCFSFPVRELTYWLLTTDDRLIGTVITNAHIHLCVYSNICQVCVYVLSLSSHSWILTPFFITAGEACSQQHMWLRTSSDGLCLACF